jgi:hypothetical protein
MERLVLQEGQEIGIFSFNEVLKGKGFSVRFQQDFHLSNIIRQAISLWVQPTL